MLQLDRIGHQELSKFAVSQGRMVTLYMKTDPHSQHADAMRIEFKNAVRDADRQWHESYGEGLPSVIKSKLDAMETDYQFWSNQALGLVVLANDNGEVHNFRLPTPVVPAVHVAEIYYCAQLALAAKEPWYWVLMITDEEASLSQKLVSGVIDRVAVDEMPDGITEGLEDILVRTVSPADRLNDAEGYRTRQVRYLKSIDEAVLPLIRDSGRPLVLVTTVEHFGEYRKINSYDGLSDHYLQRSPSDTPASTIRAGLRAIRDELHLERVRGHEEMIEDRRSSERTESDIGKITSKARAGQIETLFLGPEAQSLLESDLNLLVRECLLTGAEISPLRRDDAKPLATLRWSAVEQA